MRKHATHIWLFLFLLTLVPMKSFANEIPIHTRLGVSLGPVAASGQSFSADIGPLFSESLSLGIEVYHLRLFSVRLLIWENPVNLSGFYGGGKVFSSLGSKLEAEAGAEVGWNYRFTNRIDIGVGMDFAIARVIGGTLKINAGYLL